MLGLLAGLPVLFLVGSPEDWHSLLAGCAAGAGAGISLLLLYSSTRFLFIGVASAISAVIACVIPVAYGTVSHPLTVREGIGVSVCVVALAAVGRWRGDASRAAPPPAPLAATVLTSEREAPAGMSRLRREVFGIGAALASGACMSVYYICLAGSSGRVQVGEAIDSRITASVVVALIGLSLGGRAISPRRSLVVGSLPAGLFGIAGAMCYALSVRSGTLGIIVPIVSLSPGVTILIAWLMLRERITARQGAGLVLALAGVVLVSA